MLLEERAQGYQWIQNNGKGYIQLPLFNGQSFFHFFGTRLLAKGSETEAEHSQKITALGGAEFFARCRQVHGDAICEVNGAGREFSDEIPTGDGLTTNQSGLLITVSTADCVPVLLFDPVRRAVSAVHAGWRGSHLNISAKAVATMQTNYDSKPEDILAGIGPSIGPCCFEVGRDVWEKLERDTPYGKQLVSHGKEEKAWVNLTQLNRLQLVEAGLRSEKIQDTGLCTACAPNLFYSFRRDGKKIGNMTSGLMLTPGT
ncbi:MAG: peptidoglycan editing factor PgeF [Nitrospira sp.]|nr:peptidoglycan editing factor PgeF [Candidatus Manganitrophaceae bacterium]HIL33801.1 peptidoglycan editing factor PgeF [Candidatus Manganitrophaceae bacterium]